MARLDGTNNSDSLVGGTGDDQIRALQGDDTVHGGDGNDSLDAGGGDDLMFGDAGNDRIDGESGRDTIFGGDGDDIINGSNGAADTPGNLLDGGAGRDQVTLIVGDTASGGGGRDAFSLTFDHWTLGPGAHTEGVNIDLRGLDRHGEASFIGTTLKSFERGGLTGSRLDDAIAVGEARLYVDGNEGDDELSANGAGTLVGSLGNDRLTVSGAGATLTGDDPFNFNPGGEDVFVFRSVAAVRSTITDLESVDTIDLSVLDADVTSSGNQAFTRVDAFTGHAGELLLQAAGGETLVLIDRNGDGAADPAVLTIAGEHADFDNLIL